jgi:Bacterial type II/III secretion system short domain
MKTKIGTFAKRAFKSVLLLALCAPGVLAQTASTATKADTTQDKSRRPLSCQESGTCSLQIFHLTNAPLANDANEIQVAIRNILDPAVKIYLLPSQNAITMYASPEQLALAQKLINELDQPQKSYRITFTITETDGPKRPALLHFAMIAVPGQHLVLKQGSKVPVATGSYCSGANCTPSSSQTQFQYLDLGMNIDLTLTDIAGGAALTAKVEQLGLAEEKSGVGAQDPVIRQSALQGTWHPSLGKPMVIGALDIAGSTRHQEVEVLVEPAP